MKRLYSICCATIFLAICAGIGWFLLQFTESAPPFDYPQWETAVVIAEDSSETTIDPTTPPPELKEGEWLRYTVTMPEDRENGEWLVFDTANLESVLFLNGKELWSSRTTQDEDTANMSQVLLPLPEGGGEQLVLEVRQTGGFAMLPPMLRLSYDPIDQAGSIAYANHYGIPAGISALALALLSGVFLLSLSQRRPNWRLLLPILAAASLTGHQLALSYGSYFLPQGLQSLLSVRWLAFVAPLCLLLYLLLHREKTFWKGLGLSTFASVAALGVAYYVSKLQGGYLYRYLSEQLASLPMGYYDGLLYWFTLWLVLITTGLAAWSLVRSMTTAEVQAQTLTLKNQLMLDNMQSLEQHLRDTAAIQHETNHKIAAMDAMLQAGNLDGLAESLSNWKIANHHASQLRYSEHIAINAILLDAAARAKRAGITFQATASVPKTLPIPDEDLCILLMNMLDNAIEGAEHTPQGNTKIIQLQLRCHAGFLAIFCENTYDGSLRDQMSTRKSDALRHGFGIKQMRTIAEKYNSILDIHTDESKFVVQTALKLPE